MINTVTQTLAEILAEGSPSITTEQIDFERPAALEQYFSPRLNLYCYDIRENTKVNYAGQAKESNADQDCSFIWFDLSFLITAWDRTTLGEQHLLSEALSLLGNYRSLPEELLAPGLQGRGSLPLKVSAQEIKDTATFWSALGVPLRPALYVTVTVPLSYQPNPTSKLVSKSPFSQKKLIKLGKHS
ncbi:MAG: DUF4255 domain-containing protein [Spirulinaceae cyanobacterium]